MAGVANAFALPSGAIVVTDGLVELADDQNQIDAVLFHEMGHVVHRHGMQQILHSSFMTMAVILVSGDVTAIDNTAVALPVFLLESHYSREDETEADRYAFESMLQAGIDPGHFGRIMEKLSDSSGYGGDRAGSADETTAREKARKEGKDILDYLSTHPATPERIRQANYYSELFKEKQLQKAESGLTPEAPVH
jgi:Zn-dependent protease with chaperone function